jgi:hypothetical protein
LRDASGDNHARSQPLRGMKLAGVLAHRQKAPWICERFFLFPLVLASLCARSEEALSLRLRLYVDREDAMRGTS